MEGIMMRNGDRLSLAVRQAGSGIIAVSLPWSVLFRSSLARRRWIRGFPILLETMVNGIKALNLSAELAAEAEGEKLRPWQIAVTLILAVGLALLLFVVTPHLLALLLGVFALAGGVEGLSFHLWDGLIKFAVFIGYIAAISRLPDIRRVFQYHGAEHKTIAAFEHGEDPVSAPAAAKYSRLHPRCGTTFLLFVLSLSIFLHALTLPALLLVWHPDSPFLKHGILLLLKLLLLIPISSLSYELLSYSARLANSPLGRILTAPGLLLQILTTREPDRDQLEVGLVALREALGDSSSVTFLTPAYTRQEAD
ncbi:MAG: DUF1385 domain-containing protein [Desulfovibrio sp.]|nr:DUF1385 domain-containing protein [Desulfovibrio sp.]